MAALDPLETTLDDLASTHWVGERVRTTRRPAGDQLSLTSGRIWRIAADGTSVPVRHVVYHSPSGISWGADGVGAADTALSLLIDAGVSPDDAWRVHRSFAHDVIAHLPIVRFELPGTVMRHWLTSRR